VEWTSTLNKGFTTLILTHTKGRCSPLRISIPDEHLEQLMKDRSCDGEGLTKRSFDGEGLTGSDGSDGDDTAET
jgi:hypothetical protein